MLHDRTVAASMEPPPIGDGDTVTIAGGPITAIRLQWSHHQSVMEMCANRSTRC
jgi:hypothetical protein